MSNYILFDDEENLDIIKEVKELSGDNTENSNEIEKTQIDNEPEFQTFGQFNIDADWLSSSYNELRQLHETYEIKLLRENLYEIFVNSDFYEKYKSGAKVVKQDLLPVFLHFYDNITEKNRYTNHEKFIEIADFMSMNYEMLYKELPILYKQKIVTDVDEQYKLFDKRKTQKLF